MLSLIQSVVRQELASMISVLIFVALFVFGAKSLVEYVDKLLIDNNRCHSYTSARLRAMDHQLYHIEKDIDDLYYDDYSDTESIDSEDSKKEESDAVSENFVV